MGEFLAAVGITWFIHLLPGLVLCLPVWFLTRRRIAWEKADFSVLVVPWLAFTLMVLFSGRDVSLVTLLVQNVSLGAALVLGPLLRVAVGRRAPVRWVQAAAVTIPSIVGVVLWATVPFIGE